MNSMLLVHPRWREAELLQREIREREVRLNDIMMEIRMDFFNGFKPCDLGDEVNV